MSEKKAPRKRCHAYIVIGEKRYPCIRVPQAHDKGHPVQHASNIFTAGNKVAYITFGYRDGRP